MSEKEKGRRRVNDAHKYSNLEVTVIIPWRYNSNRIRFNNALQPLGRVMRFLTKSASSV